VTDRTFILSRGRGSSATVVRQAVACTFFAALMATSARIALPLPFTPVPFSMQPLALMLTGLFLGSRLGAVALLEYLAAGALGAPVFAMGGGGIGYLASISSLGYLLAYPVAAWVTGRLAEGGKLSFGRFLAASLAGLLVVYVGGDLYLWSWLHGSLLAAVLGGTVPFIVFDVAKAVIAAFAASRAAPSWFAYR
jgi:biotin transport system substrate-specific component